MQQGGRNPCSSSAERAGATAVAFLLPPPLLLFLLLLLLLFLLLLACLEQPRRCLCGSLVLLSPPASSQRGSGAAIYRSTKICSLTKRIHKNLLWSGNIQIHKNLLSGQTDPQKFAPERQYPDPLIQKFALPKTDWLF